MKFRPILFSTDMVQALLDDRKTMTRRTKGLEKINENPNDWQLCWVGNTTINKKYEAFGTMFQHKITNKVLFIEFPYGYNGDVLWVRESFNIVSCTAFSEGLHVGITGINITELTNCIFKADHINNKKLRWKPSIHMPKIGCRLFLEITNIRCERLQDISYEDAINEGIQRVYNISNKQLPESVKAYKDYRDNTNYFERQDYSFLSLWEKINGKESENANPWVWVIEFKRIEKPQNFI